jgi:ATP-dependent Zn protease
VPKPSETGRNAILKVHTKYKPISEGVDFADIAALTDGFSGADLKHW